MSSADLSSRVSFPESVQANTLCNSVGIGISGCVGGGIFITSGALIATTGSLGATISYVVAGGIVACVMYTLTEMVTCRPLTGALIDLPHTFLDPASGFAVAAMYGYVASVRN